GHYGKLLAPIAPDILEKILANGASDIAAGPQVIPPMLPTLRSQYPRESTDTLLLRAMFAGTQVDEMQRAQAAGEQGDGGDRPLLALIKSLYEKQKTGGRVLSTPELKISLVRGDKDVA